VEIRESAHKHGVSNEDIRHAWTHAMVLIEYDYSGEDRLLAIGPGLDGQLLELVAVPVANPARIIHADRLRPKFYDYLR
jgi:uncharacterized DUF497 family protein